MFKRFLSQVWYLELPAQISFFDNEKDEVSVMELFFDLSFVAIFTLLTQHMLESHNIQGILFNMSLFYLSYKYWTEISYYFIIFPNRSLRGRMTLLFSMLPNILIIIMIQTHYKFIITFWTLFIMSFIVFYVWFTSIVFTNKEVQKDTYNDEHRMTLKIWSFMSRENYLYLFLPVIYIIMSFFNHDSKQNILVSIVITVLLRTIFMKIIIPWKMKSTKNFENYMKYFLEFNFDIVKERMNLLLIMACGEVILSVVDIIKHTDIMHSKTEILAIIILVSYVFLWYMNFRDFFMAKTLQFGNHVQSEIGFIIFILLSMIGYCREAIIEYYHHQHVPTSTMIIIMVLAIILKTSDIAYGLEEDKHFINETFDLEQRVINTAKTETQNDYLGRFAYEHDEHQQFFNNKFINGEFYYIHNIFHLKHNIYMLIYMLIFGSLSILLHNIWLVTFVFMSSKIYDILTIAYIFVISGSHEQFQLFYKRYEKYLKRINK